MRFLDRCQHIPTVHLVQVDVVRAQPFQTLFDGGHDVLSGEPDVVYVASAGRRAASDIALRTLVATMKRSRGTPDSFSAWPRVVSDSP